MPTCLIVPLACDLAQKGRVLGPESRWRLNRALALCKQEEFQKKVLFTFSADMAPKKRFPKQIYTMATMQRQYLQAMGVPTQQLHVDPTDKLWGSYAEMESALKYAMTLEQEQLEIVFISSWYHIARLKMLLSHCRRWSFQVVPPNATISFVSSRGKLSNALKEPPKLLVQWLGLA